MNDTGSNYTAGIFLNETLWTSCNSSEVGEDLVYSTAKKVWKRMLVVPEKKRPNSYAGKIILSGLNEAAQYKAKVRAKNGEGWNRLSQSFQFATFGAGEFNQVDLQQTRQTSNTQNFGINFPIFYFVPLHTQLFAGGVKTVLKTMFIFGESPWTFNVTVILALSTHTSNFEICQVKISFRSSAGTTITTETSTSQNGDNNTNIGPETSNKSRTELTKSSKYISE
jgi:hypothetical protein